MTTGLVAVVVAAFCSGLAGVYFERVLKANPAHMQSTSELAMARSEKRFGRHCLELRRLVSDSKGSVCYAPPSVWMRNAQLGFFSFLIAVTGAEFFFQGQQQDAMRLAAENGVAYTATPVNRFQGFSSMVWCIIWIQAGGGLIIAMVIRYADNILKCFATAISIVVCGLCSSIFLHFLPSALFLLGSAVVIVATFVYSLSP